jgi:anti-anti-sigma factor
MNGDLARLEISDQGPVTVATLEGEVDVSNAADIERSIVAGARNADALVVDLGALEYLDSAGVALLHRIARTRRDEGRTLVLVVPPGAFARRVLEVTRLDAAVPVVETLDAALAGIV